jgi:hypothetical protein
MMVVMLGEVMEYPFEVPSVEHQELIQALGADGPYESLGVGIGVGSAERGLDDMGTFRAEYFVELGHALGVSVADEESRGDDVIRRGPSPRFA